MRIASLYLSGPDRWTPQAADLLASKRALCEAAGFEVVTVAQDGSGEEAAEVQARRTYAATLAALRRADAVIANLTPWRGPGCDPGTAFEAGFAAALGKPVFGYLNVVDEDEADYLGRVQAMLAAAPDEAGRWRDLDGCEVEDLGLPEGPMLWGEARRLYIVVTPDPFEELAGLEMCLEAVRLYAD